MKPKTFLLILTFLKNFVDNFEACASCNGTGFQPSAGFDACASCGGTGVQLKSRGILLSELLPDARDILDNLLNPEESKS